MRRNILIYRAKRICRGDRCLLLLRAALAMLLIAGLAAAPLSAAHAVEFDLESTWADEISSSDVSDSDIPPDDIGDFQRVPMVPLNVEIPGFYREVVNVSGMYIFTLGDGTVCKRIYGALDGVFGWYEPVGPHNYVLKGSKPIDTADDIILYEKSAAEDENDAEAHNYAGILSPDKGVTNVTSVFGIPMGKLFFFGGIGALSLCLLILIVSRAVDARRRRNKM